MDESGEEVQLVGNGMTWRQVLMGLLRGRRSQGSLLEGRTYVMHGTFCLRESLLGGNSPSVLTVPSLGGGVMMLSRTLPQDPALF